MPDVVRITFNSFQNWVWQLLYSNYTWRGVVCENISVPNGW